MRLFALLVIAALLTPSVAEAHSTTHHSNHSLSAINSYCAIKAYAKRHPDKCAWVPN